MRIFVTGATGHLGSAVVPELLDHGHEVLGLARSDASAATLADWGAEVVRGDLDDTEVLAAAAGESDGVIHLAFRHDLMRSGDMSTAVDVDAAALRAIAGAIEGTGKPLVGTGGTLIFPFAGRTGVGTEDAVFEGDGRTANENFVIGLADLGVRSSVVRLSPDVHSELDHHGFIPSLIGMARQQGAAGWLGDGTNVWPSVHTRDAGTLYRLAVESAPAGSRLHGVAEQGVPFREIAEAIGRGLGVPAVPVPDDEAQQRFTFLAGFVGVDNPVSSAITRDLLGWNPTHPTLLEDLAAGFYFRR